MAEISVIVPVYNVKKYVGKCLDSLIHQTFSDIEIICVDDASTDGSLDIVNRMSKTDSRIQIFCHTENLGTLMARKHGVERATGNFIMFVDSDDWLELNACEKLYSLMCREKVDVIQYGTNVISAVDLSSDMVSWVEKFLEPFECNLKGKEILENCFLKDNFDFNITNKIWTTILCKKAFSDLEDLKLIASEDRYAFFVLAYYSKSYIGTKAYKLYNYNLGIGVTGGDSLDLVRFEKRCTGVNAVVAVKRFLSRKGTYLEFFDIYKSFENKILWDCVDCWHNKLALSDQGTGYDILLKYWGAWKVTAAIARVYFENREEIRKKTIDSKILAYRQPIALYYRQSESSFMNKWIKKQLHMIQQSGQHVILFADEDASPEIHLQNENKVVLLPSSKEANWDGYESRAKILYEELKYYGIKLVIYTSPASHIAWLDRQLIESAHIPVLFLDAEKGCLNLERESFLLRDMKKMEKMIKILEIENTNLINSKSYKLGELLLKTPRRIKQAFIKLVRNRGEKR